MSFLTWLNLRTSKPWESGTTSGYQNTALEVFSDMLGLIWRILGDPWQMIVEIVVFARVGFVGIADELDRNTSCW